jgi:hypothetical protein
MSLRVIFWNTNRLTGYFKIEHCSRTAALQIQRHEKVEYNRVINRMNQKYNHDMHEISWNLQAKPNGIADNLQVLLSDVTEFSQSRVATLFQEAEISWVR